MSGNLISPLVLPKEPTDQRTNGSSGRIVRRPLPIAGLPSRSTGSIVYVIATVERRGRLVAHGAIQALDWPPGTTLELRDLGGGHVLIHRSESGNAGINPRGHLYLPTSLRRWCGLDTGVRVLVASDPANERLIIHRLAALDEMFRGLHLNLIGGDAK